MSNVYKIQPKENNLSEARKNLKFVKNILFYSFLGIFKFVFLELTEIIFATFEIPFLIIAFKSQTLLDKFELIKLKFYNQMFDVSADDLKSFEIS